MKNLSRIMVGGVFLRDTFSHPPCTLIQPSMQTVANENQNGPKFSVNFCPPIYPLGDNQCQFDAGVPLICLHSLQINPSPAPPSFASQTVIDCQPLMIILQEESCLRIASFLADGIVVTPGAVLPDFSVNSIVFSLKEFDLTVPLSAGNNTNLIGNGSHCPQASFSGARLHVEDLYFSQSPSVKCTLLNLDKDPACFCLWEYQPIDASQRKWTTQASHLSISLETCSELIDKKGSSAWSAGLWTCVELHDACFEAAMVTADGSPLLNVPPPGGVVRIGVACEQYSSNTSVEQLFFVLDIYTYFGRVSENITKVCRSNRRRTNEESFSEKLMEKIPSDTAVSLAVTNLHLNFLESSSMNIQGTPLVQFGGKDMFLKVSHRTLGGAFVMSTSLHWETICINCLDELAHENGIEVPGEHDILVAGNGCSPQMRPVFWIDNRSKHHMKPVPFLEISAVHVLPYNLQDMGCHSLNVSAKISGVRLGGGMNYTEALLHRFGVLGPDGGPGERLSKGIKNLSSGPLAKLFRTSSLMEADHGEDGYFEGEDHNRLLELGMPDDVDVSIELKNWLFALEGTQEMGDGFCISYGNDANREERSWHTTFQLLQVKAKSSHTENLNKIERSCRTQKYPVELITVSIEGLQALKPHYRSGSFKANLSGTNVVDKDLTIKTVGDCEGVNIEVRLIISENETGEMVKWTIENIKFSVKQPIEAVATKEELEHLALLCKSEVDSIGRIAAGVLRLLKLEESIGHAAIDQLSNLGSDKLFTPEKLSRRSSFGSVSFTPTSNAVIESPNRNLESTIALLEAEASDSQAKCSTLISELGLSEHSADLKQLNQKLESMQTLLMKLRALV